MPTSDPGNKPLGQHQGFTLIELLVVIAIMAISTAVISLAMPNPATSRLEREASRLVAFLESARAQARAGGLTVMWLPQPAGGETDFQFLGLPTALMPSPVWLERDVRAEVVGARSIVLGPEPVIGPQSLVLRLGDQQLVVSSDGLSPFETVHGDAPNDDLPPADPNTDPNANPNAQPLP